MVLRNPGLPFLLLLTFQAGYAFTDEDDEDGYQQYGHDGNHGYDTPQVVVLALHLQLIGQRTYEVGILVLHLQLG